MWGIPIATRVASHIHNVTPARFSRFTYGRLFQFNHSLEMRSYIVIKHTILWTHIIDQSLGGSPFNPYSSPENSLWNSQKSIKKYTKTAIFWPQSCKFSSAAEGFAPKPPSLWQLGLCPQTPGLRRPVIQTFLPTYAPPSEIPAYATGKNT